MDGSPALGCLLLPRFCLALEVRERPELAPHPLALCRRDETEVWLASDVALGLGIRPGQPVTQALALCPRLQLLEARTAHYQRELEKIFQNLHQVIFAIEMRPLEEGVIYLGLSGHGSIEVLAPQILACTHPTLQSRLGISINKFMARVAADCAAPLGTYVIAQDAVQGHLRERSVELLPVSTEAKRRLQLLGLQTLDQIASLPKTAMISAFGSREGQRIWELATGADDEPLHRRQESQSLLARISLEAPIRTSEILLAALEQVLNRLCHSPAFMHNSARKAHVRLITERGDEKEVYCNFHDAISDAAALRRLLSAPIRNLQLPGPVTEIELELMGIAPAQGWQSAFSHTHGGRKELLQDGLRKLVIQYGSCPVSQAVPLDPDNRLPENRWALIDCNP